MNLEARFEHRWAQQKRAQDRAALAFFILLLLLVEAASLLLGYTGQVIFTASTFCTSVEK